MPHEDRWAAGSGRSQAHVGALWLVSTPIGNMGDVTQRAVERLRGADLILCEDTRHSRPFLHAIGALGPVSSLHAHNEERATARIIERLRTGANVALISDAGTPLVSDPGFRLVRSCIAAGIPVVPIPGASAVLAAVAASGLVEGPFTFLGFLPRKGKERRGAIAVLSSTAYPSVLFEAANRVPTTLKELARACGESRAAAVCRELTKKFEEIRRGSLGDLALHFSESPARGEIVIVISGAQEVVVSPSVALERVGAVAKRLRDQGHTVRDVARTLQRDHGIARNAAYAIVRKVEQETPDEK
jgi:16S rRNA (cytidine1402-2'-O)-methyltransferase